MSRPTPPLIITFSSPSDISTLASIPPLAMKPDLIGRALYANPEDITNGIKWKTAEIAKSLQNPDHHVFHASLKPTGEIVGHAIVKFENGGEGGLVRDGSGGSAPPTEIPPFFNADFARTLFGGLEAKRKRHMGERKHVVWSSLFIKPGYQRQGFGEAMLRWGFETLGLDKEEIWLTTQMLGRSFYRRFGWEDVDAVDMDLGHYLGELRGFGVHRTVCMIRKPWALVKWKA